MKKKQKIDENKTKMEKKELIHLKKKKVNMKDKEK